MTAQVTSQIGYLLAGAIVLQAEQYIVQFAVTFAAGEDQQVAAAPLKFTRNHTKTGLIKQLQHLISIVTLHQN